MEASIKQELLLLHRQATELLDAVTQIKPEAIKLSGYGSELIAFIKPYNAYLDRAYRLFCLDDTQAAMAMIPIQRQEENAAGMNPKEARQRILTGLGELLAILESRIPEAATSKNYNLNNLHPEINAKCHELYVQKHYAEAVEKSFKVVKDRLRQLTGYEKGSDAFGNTKLHVKGAAAPHVDEDFNEGVRFLTMAIDRFRNEKAHTSDAKIENSVRAYEYLRLSSLAMNLLDNAEIKK